MKKILLFITLLAGFSSRSQVNPNAKHIQVAILFDTSNSMDGLISQAKSRIWAIVNTLTTLRYNGEIPVIELALYDYGNDNNTMSPDYIRQVAPLTTDLDLMSQQLFGLTTRGGNEYCGAVIGQSLKEIAWTNSPTDLRIIYIAGNEPFNQGPVNYKTICKTAVERDIQINTIYCGDYQMGISEFWYDGAQIGKGEYSNIDANRQVVQYVTPYDVHINAYNDSLNHTYMGYGMHGKASQQNQVEQDKNAAAQSVSTKAERASVKAKAAYNNASWDVVDGVKSNKVKVAEMKEEELPDDLKGKTAAEKEAIVQEKSKDREKYQQKIQELSAEREKYILAEKQKSATGAASDFGSSITQNIVTKAKAKGYTEDKK
jgi:hypothetical protein